MNSLSVYSTDRDDEVPDFEPFAMNIEISGTRSERGPIDTDKLIGAAVAALYTNAVTLETRQLYFDAAVVRFKANLLLYTDIKDALHTFIFDILGNYYRYSMTKHLSRKVD